MDKQTVLDLLKTVKYPGFTRDIVSFGMVDDMEIQGDAITVTLKISTQQEEKKAVILAAVEEVLKTRGGFTSVTLTLQDAPTATTQPDPVAATGILPDSIRHVIAVASGKGGVGKSTVAANLALALKNKGKAVGLLDLDIYGPSLPLILGLNRPPEITPERKLVPLEKFGLKAMSFGFISGNNTPAIWRGPMVARMTEQFFSDVLWGNLDILILDLPPGTGDIQLTLTQKVALTGAVIVTTPQDIALADVQKGADMFEKVNTPVLGVVENMSGLYLEGEASGATSLTLNGTTVPLDSDGRFSHRLDIFKRGGGKAESTRLDVPLLAEIPLALDLMTATDEGRPLVASAPESAVAACFVDLADKLIQRIAAE
ncbi:MAG: P-loop NTPase [Fidelibacterota bacterium]